MRHLEFFAIELACADRQTIAYLSIQDADSRVLDSSQPTKLLMYLSIPSIFPSCPALETKAAQPDSSKNSTWSTKTNYLSVAKVKSCDRACFIL